MTGTGVFFEDRIGLGGPLEGLRFDIALGDPGFDCCFEIADALEHAAPDALAGDLGEQPLVSTAAANCAR